MRSGYEVSEDLVYIRPRRSLITSGFRSRRFVVAAIYNKASPVLGVSTSLENADAGERRKAKRVIEAD